MSAWTVYWTLQLDSIISMFAILAVVTGVVAGILAVIGGLMCGEYCERDRENGLNLLGYSKRLWVAFVVSLFAVNFIPSSKTAAAMIVLPALTSEEVVGTVKSEAKELYEMAKEALKDKITTTEEKKVEGND